MFHLVELLVSALWGGRGTIFGKRRQNEWVSCWKGSWRYQVGWPQAL